MNKESINGVTYTNFGSNNYSHGMEAVIFNPKDITLKSLRILPGFYLHPTVEPNSLEVFALKGTLEQFNAFEKSAVESWATKKAVDKYGLNFSDEHVNLKRNAMIDMLVETFVPWYE